MPVYTVLSGFQFPEMHSLFAHIADALIAAGFVLTTLVAALELWRATHRHRLEQRAIRARRHYAEILEDPALPQASERRDIWAS